VRCAAAQHSHGDDRERGGGGDARTLLFDEVDAAVGGRLAARIAECLAELGGSGQVVAVTHQAAVAARADTHVAVAKSIVGGRAVSRALPLTGDERVEELAAMIAGADATDNARREARRMLATARLARDGRMDGAPDAAVADGAASTEATSPPSPTDASSHGPASKHARPRPVKKQLAAEPADRERAATGRAGAGRSETGRSETGRSDSGRRGRASA
jgi:hypothetical protein